MSEPTIDNPRLRKIGAYECRVWKDTAGWWFKFPWMKEPEGPYPTESCTGRRLIQRSEKVKDAGSRIGERVSGPGGGVQTNRGFYSGD